MTRILTTLVLVLLTGSTALAEDGSGAIACVLDEADNVFLVSPDALFAVDGDGEVVELTSFEIAPTGVAISEEAANDRTVPEACAAAEGIYRTTGEGIVLTFDDAEAATGFAGDTGEVVEVEEVEPLSVSVYNHAVFEDASGGQLSTQTPLYLFLSDDRMQISKPVYRTAGDWLE